ncbi:MAG: glycosidase [Symploca sp. SIO2D2]|nr:glycosidase [Symploca sp. SIO2D2]
MSLEIKRCPENPIVRPGKFPWRQAVVFNPAVIYDEGRFYMYERAGGGLRPFHNYIGALASDDGVHFEHLSDEPVLTPEMCGSAYGSVQDPRVVKIEDTFYMTFAFRPYAWNSYPTGLGVPESSQADYEGVSFDPEENQTRSGIAVSKDRINWEFNSWTSGMDIDDRNHVLFPEKIGGRFVLLRRPQRFVGTNTEHDATPPCIQISYSEDLSEWTEPEVVIAPKFAWEDNRIGGSAPPIKTEHGWLTTYHGVENQDDSVRRVCYRVGLMLLDLENPTKVIARCPEFIMEPTEYYEKTGLYIPNVVFPTAAVVVNDHVHIYYGCCDTAIGLATCSLERMVDHVLKTGVAG